MERKKPTEEKDTGRKLRFLNVVNEGSRWFSFVVCQTKTSDVIIYAWLNDLTGTTHTTIFNLAVEDFGFNEKYEPVGGGSVNVKTCELQASIHYGGIDDENIKTAVFRKACKESEN